MGLFGHMIQFRKPPGQPIFFFKAPEMFNKDLFLYSGSDCIDWFQYGYLLIIFLGCFSKESDAKRYQMLLSPLISGLIVRHSEIRISFIVVFEYFKLLSSVEVGVCIGREQITTTTYAEFQPNISSEIYDNQELGLLQKRFCLLIDAIHHFHSFDRWSCPILHSTQKQSE